MSDTVAAPAAEGYRRGFRYPRYVATDDLLGCVGFENSRRMPKIILSIGPCRSGTNVSLRLYAEVGIPAFNQPLKGIFRHLAKGKNPESCHWIVPEGDFVYVKETTGPFSSEESLINPLDLVIQLAERTADERPLAERLHVVVMGRQPFDTWYSWDEAYFNLLPGISSEEFWYYDLSPQTRFEFFISAYKQVESLRRQSLRAGVPVTHYVAEANRQPERAVGALFRSLGIHAAPKLSRWSEASTLGRTDSRAFLSPDHDTQIRARMFEKVNESTGIKFMEGRGDRLAPELHEAISSAGLCEIYDEWRRATETDLDISID